jgi:hypothetical protein
MQQQHGIAVVVAVDGGQPDQRTQQLIGSLPRRAGTELPPEVLQIRHTCQDGLDLAPPVQSALLV